MLRSSALSLKWHDSHLTRTPLTVAEVRIGIVHRVVESDVRISIPHRLVGVVAARAQERGVLTLNDLFELLVVTDEASARVDLVDIVSDVAVRARRRGIPLGCDVIWAVRA